MDEGDTTGGVNTRSADFLRSLTAQLAEDIFTGAVNHGQLLREGAKNAALAFVGRHTLALRSADLTEEQIRAVEEMVVQAYADILHVLFKYLGGQPPEGWPDARITDPRTGYRFKAEELQFALAGALSDYRERHGRPDEGTRDLLATITRLAAGAG